MCESTMVQAWLEEGREEGREATSRRAIRNLIKMGMTLEQVAQVLEISIDEVQRLSS